jgi:hypothetical protein
MHTVSLVLNLDLAELRIYVGDDDKTVHEIHYILALLHSLGHDTAKLIYIWFRIITLVVY